MGSLVQLANSVKQPSVAAYHNSAFMQYLRKLFRHTKPVNLNSTASHKVEYQNVTAGLVWREELIDYIRRKGR